MPFLDDRAPIVPITNPTGTLTNGYIQCHGQIVSQDPFYHLRPKGNAQYLTPDKRVKWNPPDERSSKRSDQVEEKIQIYGVYPSSFSVCDTFLIFISGIKDKDQQGLMPSTVAIQSRKGVIGNYNNSTVGTKNYIQTHGTEKIPQPNQYAQVYSGAEVITNTYSKKGKENAFTENSDGTTFSPINIKKHSVNDNGIRGSTLAGFKARGTLK